MGEPAKFDFEAMEHIANHQGMPEEGAVIRDAIAAHRALLEAATEAWWYTEHATDDDERECEALFGGACVCGLEAVTDQLLALGMVL